MKRRTFVAVAMGTSVAWAGARCDWAEAPTGRPITILKPAAGAKVGREMTVEGMARLSPGQSLWVLTRRADFAPLWWPQRHAVVDPRSGSWKATAAFGKPVDVGRDFDIGVVAVDGATHKALQEYWTRSMTSDEWRPIEVSSFGAAAVVKVRKIRH